MSFQKRISIAVGVTILAFQFGLSAQAADRYRSVESGHPRELINQPICWPAEQPDDPNYCDFAQRL
jgi:hypothetical protein